jgi:hypothetical protein
VSEKPEEIGERSISEHLDAVVEYLLRDRDYLIAKEIRTKVEQLNQLLVLAANQNLKVEFTTKKTEMESGSSVTVVDAHVYKKI